MCITILQQFVASTILSAACHAVLYAAGCPMPSTPLGTLCPSAVYTAAVEVPLEGVHFYSLRLICTGYPCRPAVVPTCRGK